MKRRDFLKSAAWSGLVLPIAARGQSEPCPPPALSGTSGTSTQTICQPSPAMPQYMSGMADFQVKQLTTVTTGAATMYDALPAEWRRTGQPNGADSVLAAWSGGGKGDALGRRLFAHGGGHGDSSNNGLYVYDFSGDMAPTGWSVAPNSLSPLSAVVAGVDTYSDGKPTAIHSYDGMWYDPTRKRFWRVGGSGYGPTGTTGESTAFYYDFNTTAWSSNLGGSPISSLGSALIGAPDGSAVLFLSAAGTNVFIDAASGAKTPAGSSLFGSEEAGPCAVWDSARSRFVVFYHSSAGPRVQVVTVNWSGKSVNASVQTLSGTYAGDLNNTGACVMYDPLRDSFWSIANSADTQTGSIPNIYEISASTFAVTRYALSSPVPSLLNCKGGYNRHVWFPDWRIVGTVHAHNQPMSLVKLPSRKA
jgi:hypothetical protein